MSLRAAPGGGSRFPLPRTALLLRWAPSCGDAEPWQVHAAGVKLPRVQQDQGRVAHVLSPVEMLSRDAGSSG